MTDPTNDNGNTKLITMKKFFIFNSKFGLTEGEVILITGGQSFAFH